MSWRNRNLNALEYKEYRRWREAVMRRDKHSCQWPGCTHKHRKGLQVHHIRKWAVYPSLRYVVENGITLCAIHHKSICKNEDDYIIMFMRILLQKLKDK